MTTQLKINTHAVLTKQKSFTVAENENPFYGKDECGNIYHLKPSEVGLGQVCSDRKYGRSTCANVFEYTKQYGKLPIFGKPCDIKLLDTTFEVLSLSGYGSYGQVYRTQIKGRPEKQFALKVLLAKSGRCYQPDREFKVIQSVQTKMFDSTQRAAHIIPFLAVAERAEVRGSLDKKVQCGLVLMDFASNGEVFDAIVKGDADGDRAPNAFNARFTRRLLRQAIFGLERLLAFGYTHRDLKPDNMLFDAHGDLVLCDLGHVKNLREGSDGPGTPVSNQVQTASNIGTKRYSAPELLRAAKDGFRQMKYDSMKSDIWSIGITAFQLRTCICPLDVNDQLLKVTLDDLDVAPIRPHGCTKAQPDEFDVDANKTNRRLWYKWDKFFTCISPNGAWYSAEWVRDYMTEQFSPDERAFLNLLLQKDPRCRVSLKLLAKAARGDMTGVPKGLAWIAKDDVPSDDEFRTEMKKRIPGFGTTEVVRKRVSSRQLRGLVLKGVPVTNKTQAARAIVATLIEGGEFSRPVPNPSAAVEYTVDYRVDKKTCKLPTQPMILMFEDKRHHLQVICKVYFNSDTRMVECHFSRARGDAMLHLLFMRKFDIAFRDKAPARSAGAAAAAAATTTAGSGRVTAASEGLAQKVTVAKGRVIKGESMTDTESEFDSAYDFESEESDDEDCVQSDS